MTDPLTEKEKASWRSRGLMRSDGSFSEKCLAEILRDQREHLASCDGSCDRTGLRLRLYHDVPDPKAFLRVLRGINEERRS